MTLRDYPGFTLLAGDVQALLLRMEAGDDDARPALLQKTADVLNVFVGLNLLEFVFMPPPDDAPAAREIDLIAPPPEEEAAIAWFSVDEAGYDEFRDAVSLFGDLTDVLGAPIVLDPGDAE